MAIAITTTINWGFNYLTSSIYLQVTDGPFGKVAVYAVMALSCIAAFGFTYRFVPETKDRNVEECVNMVMLARYTPVTGGGEEIPEDQNEDGEINGALLDKRPKNTNGQNIQMAE